MRAGSDAQSFDAAAAQLLRQAGRLAGDGRATVEHLRLALEAPAPESLPPTVLRLDPSLDAVVRRAARLAAGQEVESISSEHLRDAVLEADGLALDRLRFARWRADRAYPTTPRLRCYRTDPSEPTTLQEERTR